MKHKIEKYIGSKFVGFELEEENSGTLKFDRGEVHFCCDITLDSKNNLLDTLTEFCEYETSIIDASKDNKGNFELVFGYDENKTVTIQFFEIEGGGFHDKF